MALRRLLPLAAIFALVGCRSDETIARESFGSRFTCPEDRITVTRRADLHAVDLAFRAEPPPADIAADPARLALWNKEQEKKAAEYADKNVVQARGCDHELLFVCGDLRVSVGATRHGCMAATYAPDSAPRPPPSAATSR